MMWFIKFMQKRPSDMNIRVFRVLLWLIISSSLYYNLIYQWDSIASNYFWMEVAKENLIYIKYWFIAIGILPIIIWAANMCVFKKKWVRIIQILLGFVLFYVSAKITPWDENKIDVDSLIGFVWIFPIFAWITGKMITTKCLKFGEKITKIRV
jgi:xanthine/uracil permease